MIVSVRLISEKGQFPGNDFVGAAVCSMSMSKAVDKTNSTSRGRVRGMGGRERRKAVGRRMPTDRSDQVAAAASAAEDTLLAHFTRRCGALHFTNTLSHRPMLIVSVRLISEKGPFPGNDFVGAAVCGRRMSKAVDKQTARPEGECGAWEGASGAANERLISPHARSRVATQ